LPPPHGISVLTHADCGRACSRAFIAYQCPCN